MNSNELVSSVIQRAYEVPWFRKVRRERAQTLAGTVELKPGEKMLEIGTGKGDVFRMLTEKYPMQCISLDILSQVVEANKSQKDLRLEADGRKCPFQDDTFTHVLICLVLHHIPSSGSKDIIKEALRVGEKITIVEDAIDKPLLGSLEVRKKVVGIVDTLLNFGVPGGNQANHRQISEWQQIIQECGGKVEKIDNVSLPLFGIFPWAVNVLEVKRDNS